MTYICMKCKQTYERQEPIGLDDYCPTCSCGPEGIWQMLRPCQGPNGRPIGETK